ncbi:hypothetical protein F5J12DRAFT_819149 [Pisolithus orientalis]|uniref:uncharacterized protein n=1 Tax=Pisolithus orientalis TaxID=936130 RepID=UPI002224AA9D|nr:uncharacterized protein F5J12DRAFT_819149 [Pisolithus orientalis]KAI6012610.1 hypothetical protein F5J12DRAFT_819149 [Pisolithus orientalis]
MAYPSTIQAITITETGGPEVLEKTEIPRGIYPPDKFPFVIGVEVSGTIVRLPTDPAVLNDPDYQKREYKHGSRVAVDSLSSHAEYISVAWKTAYPVPESITARTAAASLIQGLTAISFMEESYNVQKGDIILIHTIAGGLGLLMCQFAKYRGAMVIGTTSNGADHVITYKEEDTVARVLDITNDEGVHAIFDGVGKDTFEADFRMIRRKGTLVSMGGASGPVPPFAPLKLSEKNVRIVRPRMSNYAYTPSESLYYGDALFSPPPLIHKEYPFTAEGAREAHMDLIGGKTVGKLLIKVGN